MAASFDDLPSLVGGLKRAAIDAYMRTQSPAWRIDGDAYEQSSRGTFNRVTRPGADGEGGGDWSTDDFVVEWLVDGSKDEAYGEAFATIRSRIDAAIEPWLDLPDPERIVTDVEACRQVTSGLSGAAAISDGGLVGAGRIPGNLALILENSDAMAGAAIAAFKSKFVLQLGAAVGGYHGISVVLGSVLAAEQGLWDAARSDVAHLVEVARDSAQSVADTGVQADGSVALDVVGWAAKGAKLFLPGAGVVFEGVGLGLEVIKGTAGERKAQVGAESADEVLAAFEASLSELNAQILAEETSLEENLARNLAHIRADRESYDLTVPPVSGEQGGDHELIAYQPPLIEEISSTYLPAIADELTTVAARVRGLSFGDVVRDGSLGIGRGGPSASWYELRHLLNELLKNTAWDVRMGAKDLGLALDELQGHEAQIAAEIDEFLAQLGAGNPTDPWN